MSSGYEHYINKVIIIIIIIIYWSQGGVKNSLGTIQFLCYKREIILQVHVVLS